jgi:anti-sigma regulatory factor (Ser/Thr protein kinase)
MRVHLPNSAFLGNIDAFLNSLDLADRSFLHITANKKWISVHPLVLAMVASLGRLVPPGGVSCDAFEAKSSHYFERMGLFRFLGVDFGIPVTEHEAAGRFVPLTQILDSAALSKFVTDMVPLLHLDPTHAEPIRYIVSELVRNVLEHAESPHGAFVAAQYYTKSNAIRIGICDIGAGIKKTIGRSHVVTDDLEAVRLALQVLPRARAVRNKMPEQAFSLSSLSRPLTVIFLQSIAVGVCTSFLNRIQSAVRYCARIRFMTATLPETISLFGRELLSVSTWFWIKTKNFLPCLIIYARYTGVRCGSEGEYVIRNQNSYD